MLGVEYLNRFECYLLNSAADTVRFVRDVAHPNCRMMYDTFHDLADPDGVLEELNRVLKPHGILSFSDHHMKENDITSGITKKGLFRLLKKQAKTYSFAKRVR
jgi:sugar phosphate isomerase/epimerase